MVGAGLRTLRRWAAGSGLAALALVTAIGTLPAGPAWANGKLDAVETIRFDDPGRVTKRRLAIHKSRILRADHPFGDVLVANSAIADVQPLTDRSIYIVGKKIGITRLTVLDSTKNLLGLVELEVGFDTEGLEDELRHSVPGGEFRIRTANGRILLGGSVPDALALAKAVDITEQFTSGCAAQELKEIADAVSDEKPLGPFATQVTEKGASKTNGPTPKCFVNSLVVRAPQQVLLEVRFVEAQRTAARDLGVSWNAHGSRFSGVAGATVDSEAGIIGPIIQNAFVQGLPSGNTPFGTLVARVLSTGASADALIQALEKKGLARRLAEPNLVTLSGDTANFHAGGEFPYPEPQANSGGGFIIATKFKRFGISLGFTPTVLAEGQINLKIEPEVSDLDPNTIVSVGGTAVPALTVRRASTTVELRDGQSFAIAGLLQTNHTKNLNQLPLLGEIPVLGVLFRSASYAKQESDLVIIVTPRLVRPAVPGQKLLTPLDQKLASNEREFLKRGVMEVPKHFPAPYGHVLDVHGEWAAATIREVDHASYK
jgi:pilus assembly protein CpaC